MIVVRRNIDDQPNANCSAQRGRKLSIFLIIVIHLSTFLFLPAVNASKDVSCVRIFSIGDQLTFYEEILDPDIDGPSGRKVLPIYELSMFGLERMVLSPVSANDQQLLEARWKGLSSRSKQFTPDTLLLLLGQKNASERAKPSLSVSQSPAALQNWILATTLLASWVKQGRQPSIDGLQQLNNVLTFGANDEGASMKAIPGKFRDGSYAPRILPNMLSRGVTYLPGNQTRIAMARFFEWYLMSSQKLHPVELAARSYRWLLSIHPFADGNGRTCRLFLDWILLNHGLPPATFENQTPSTWNVANSDHAVAVFGHLPENYSSPQIRVLQNITNVVERSVGLLDQH